MHSPQIDVDPHTIESMSRTVFFASLIAAAALVACGGPAPAVPTATTSPTVVPTATTAAIVPTATTASAAAIDVPAAQKFAPRQRSVWETTVGPDQMRGECPKGSIVPPYGPVLITPRDDGGFDWKDVQNGVYAFTPTAAGAFAFAGPNGRKDGVLTMTLIFDTDKNFSMQAEYVRSDAPACTHAYEYAGVYKFDR